MTFPLLTINTIFELLLNSITVRIHSNLSRYCWARAWYLCRSFDLLGVGHVTINLNICCSLLSCGQSTFYRYLDKGRRFGAFRFVKSLGNNNFEIYLTSLNKLCRKLHIKDYGAVGEVPLLEVFKNLRHVGTRLTTQKLQIQSHYAAVRNLTTQGKKTFKPPTALEILELARASDVLGLGHPHFITFIGKRRLFVSHSFTPFGGSQKGVAKRLKISERTVRRHLLTIDRRQIMQSKGEYRRVKAAITHEADFCEINQDMWVVSSGNSHELRERPRGGKNFRIPRYITCDSFSEYYDKPWLHCCNLYWLNFHLCKMKSSKGRLNILFENESLEAGPRWWGT